MEKQEKIADDLRQKKLEKAEALVKQKEINEQLKVAEESLAEMEAAFQKFNDEAASVEKMAENIPKISETRILMYKISRLTFDVNKKEGLLKGFVQLCNANPQVLNLPELEFYRSWLQT